MMTLLAAGILRSCLVPCRYLGQYRPARAGLPYCCLAHCWSEFAIRALSLWHRPANACLGLPGRRAASSPAGHPACWPCGFSTGARRSLCAGCTTANVICVRTTGRRPASTAARQRRTGGPAAGQHQPALFALFGELLLPVLGLFHLLFVPKNRLASGFLFGLVCRQLPLLPRGVAYQKAKTLQPLPEFFRTS